jgi:hypothetical protein
MALATCVTRGIEEASLHGRTYFQNFAFVLMRILQVAEFIYCGIKTNVIKAAMKCHTVPRDRTNSGLL